MRESSVRQSNSGSRFGAYVILFFFSFLVKTHSERLYVEQVFAVFHTITLLLDHMAMFVPFCTSCLIFISFNT